MTDDHTLAFCLSRSGSHTKTQLQAIGNTHMGLALDNLFIFSQGAEEPFILEKAFNNEVHEEHEEKQQGTA